MKIHDLSIPYSSPATTRIVRKRSQFQRLKSWAALRVERSIERTIISVLEVDPVRQLSPPVFRLALGCCLKRHWPDADREIAAGWLLDYIGVRAGVDGFDWSYATAKLVAQEYSSIH